MKKKNNSHSYNLRHELELEEHELEPEVIRFSVGIPMNRNVHEKIKAYAKARRMPITAFIYQIIIDYLKKNPLEIY